MNIYKYLKGAGRQMDETRLSLVVCSDSTRSNGLKLEHRKFCTNMWKNFFMVRVTEHWNRLPREVVASVHNSIYGDIRDPSGCLPPCAIDCRVPALSEKLGSMIP